MRYTLLLVLLASPLAASDLEDCLDAIKRSGMSERASDTLHGVASLLAGQGLYTCEPSEKGFRMSYRSGGACMRPGLSDEQKHAVQVQLDTETEKWKPFVKTHTDANADGFVSTEEAREMKRAVELGFCVEGLPEKDAEGIAKRVGRKRAEVEKDLNTLAILRDALKKQGLSGVPGPVEPKAQRNAEK